MKINHVIFKAQLWSVMAQGVYLLVKSGHAYHALSLALEPLNAYSVLRRIMSRFDLIFIY